MLDRLNSDETIVEEADTLGGGSTVLESDAYDLNIDLAYLSESKGGALSLVVDFKGKNKEKLTQVFWMTSGTAKGGKNYYIDKKSGDKRYLPGFSAANSLCRLVVGKEIGSLNTQKKVINKWNYDLKKMAPTEVDMFMDLLGLPVTVGVIKQVVDKTAITPGGTYEPTGETREENEVDKFFRTLDKLTATEIKAGATEASFFDSWVEKNKGVTRNKAKGAGANAPLSTGNNTSVQQPTESLFATASPDTSINQDAPIQSDAPLFGS